METASCDLLSGTAEEDKRARFVRFAPLNTRWIGKMMPGLSLRDASSSVPSHVQIFIGNNVRAFSRVRACARAPARYLTRHSEGI